MTRETTPRMSSRLYDYDLAIVGGGVVGATLACALKDSGLTVVLIEAEARSIATARGQAYNISPLSSRIFNGIGIWNQIRPQLETYTRIRLSDADCPNVVQFVPQDLGAQTLGYVAEHQVLIAALQESLRQSSHVTWLCPATVVKTDIQPDGATLEIVADGEAKQIWTRLVVAADGARSPLRQQAKIRTHGWQYWQSCVVATIKPEKSHNHTAYERFWSSGPFAILPLTGDRCRIVWTAPRAEADAIVALDDDQFLKELTQRYGDHMGKLALEGDRYVFPVRLMHSTRYVLPRLALIGDAAHCCHPVGGQGINMGIRDAAALAQVLQTAHQQGEDIATLKVLKRYERWRKWENLIILGFTDILDRTFSNNVFPIVLVRRLGLWVLQTVLPAKSFALRLMTGLTGRVPKLAQKQASFHP
ncbi:MAG: FAD-dependent hydroxylase [Candidatus Parcubacteria bacterium]|nr:FAD-dependent hydroxylase [Leptolyngbyaceae cyanobacterium LF-bin-113]